jgi:hypothetical protein
MKDPACFFTRRRKQGLLEGFLIRKIETIDSLEKILSVETAVNVGDGFPDQPRHLFRIFQEGWPTFIKGLEINIHGDEDQQLIHF